MLLLLEGSLMPLTQQQQQTTTRADALAAMRARRIVRPERYVDHATPAAIIAACEWWDAQPYLRTGALVDTIKDGGMTPPRPAPPRRRVGRRQLERYRELGMNDQQIAELIGSRP